MLPQYHPIMPSSKGPFFPFSTSMPLSGRDEMQNNRLHKPGFRGEHTDPMPGMAQKPAEYHPSITKGDLSIHFATEKSRQTYWHIPLVHPNLRRPWYQVMQDDDRGS
jgi:hypothetical protein